ncbi:UDP-N-acetylmuramoyl-L-alanyl-D-glutamate--2,6-diaminopimelate ligase [Candidatus Kuenenbacteria bacterium]|nr:UDP-N-acetylmuramoyl-L-alanyl-D-glutamate--2,6-diaminopimelate ligase [Candidatus Kuenenbacteria bacterium]
MIKTLIKKLIPKFLLGWYHLGLAVLAKWYYSNPSGKLIVIGVTGTNGKSTTVNLIGKILEETGAKVGWTTTVNFKVAGKKWLNDKKMTMVGRMQLQKLLAEMVKAGCRYAVIETSSEGIKQHRHSGINYDVAVFTNLTPEHIESHGSFENYKKAKGKLFVHLMKCRRKIIAGQKVPKISVVNLDSEHADYYLNFPADKKWGYTAKHKTQPTKLNNIIMADNVKIGTNGSEFEVENVKFTTKLPGEFNVENCLSAIATAGALNIGLEISKNALEKIDGVAGRMEFIDEGQNFQVLVDYAPEPESMRRLYEFINNNLRIKGKIIHVLGSCGGGRDKSRRPVLGKMAAENAEAVIVTNEDPYDDEPIKIINEVAAGSEEIKKLGNKKVEVIKILDRREAIRKAIELAKENDLVLLTGKGAEQFICVAKGEKIPWDERMVAREELRKLNK